MKFRKTTLVLALTTPLITTAATGPDPMPVKAHVVEARGRTLSSVLSEIKAQSGVNFVWPDALRDDRLNGRYSGNTWFDLARQMFSEYSYVTRANEDGRLVEFIITGRLQDGRGRSPTSGDGATSATLFRDTATGQYTPPESIQDLPPDTFSSIEFDRQQLTGMKVGDRVKLSLGSSDYEVVHDNRYEHANGDLTWVGYLDNEGKEYRVVVTLGNEGNTGQINTPDGLYRIETGAGHDWLVNVNAAGLGHPTFEGDDHLPPTAGAASASGTALAAAVPTANATATATSYTVDLMVLYTAGMVAKPVATRLNNLVALSNQAYRDSKVNTTLRLVHSLLVNYTETNSNSTALSDLTNLRSPFTNVGNLRTQYGADLVTLIRPYKSASQGGCGVGWVNGAYGGTMYARYGYSVVSDGVDGRYYCSNYSLAHELGHNMGSNHDKAHSSFQGKYAFSYGYGRANVYGTIMSYFYPVVGVFSTPNTTVSAAFCKGYPCGVANQADNARSLNLTVPTVSAFQPTKR